MKRECRAASSFFFDQIGVKTEYLTSSADSGVCKMKAGFFPSISSQCRWHCIRFLSFFPLLFCISEFSKMMSVSDLNLIQFRRIAVVG